MARRQSMSRSIPKVAVAALTIAVVASLASAFEYVSQFDSDGVPDDLLATGESYSDDFRQAVSVSLPERTRLQDSHPHFVETDGVRNLHLDDEVDVTISFVHEGAGYRNSVGYFLFDPDSPPTDIDDIDHVIVFPNTSFSGSGGGMTMGDTLDLGTFSGGQAIGFFVIANGFSNGTVRTGNQKYYSIDALNPESSADDRVHSVLLIDPDSDRFVLAFEDLRRDSSGCDHDFNDVILSVQVTPNTAVDTTGMEDVDDVGDDDEDGVYNEIDAYPADADRATSTFYPSASTTGTIAFEDLWPDQGDADFNDLVTSYRFEEIRNASGKLTALKARFQLLAMGAARHNGLYLRLPGVYPASIDTVTRKVNTGTPTSTAELTSQTFATFEVMEDAHDHISPESGYDFANTQPGSGSVTGDTIELEIEFSPALHSSALGAAPYDTFLKNGGIEVHLPGRLPSDTIASSLLGTSDDATDVDEGVTFVTSTGIPWALVVPSGWKVPAERVDVTDAYRSFASWVESAGAQDADWYDDPDAYPDVWEPR
jgi:LruC domain-containing protein